MTITEIREAVTGQFGADVDAFDVECAIYWYAANWHGGQGSELYGVLSASAYRPGPLERGPRGFIARAVYGFLEGEMIGC